MVRFIKKSFLYIFFLLSCIGVFALDTQLDVLAGGFYNYINVFKGSASYQKVINYDYYDFDGDYRAAFNAGGGLRLVFFVMWSYSAFKELNYEK